MKAKVRRFLLGLLRLIAGGMLGFVSIMPLASLAKTRQLTFLNSPLVFLFFLVATFFLAFILAVASHELGHVIAGARAGFRFLFLIFWPLKIMRTGQKRLSVRLFTSSGIGLGGLAGMVPKNHSGDFVQSYRHMIIGGPVASVSLGTLFLALALLLGVTKNNSLAAAIFWIFGVINLYIFLLTIIPYRRNGLLTDGALWLYLRNASADEVKLLRTLVETSAQMPEGIRPSEIAPETLITFQNTPPSNPYYQRAQFYLFLNAMDRCDYQSARTHMNSIWSRPDTLHPLIMHKCRLYAALLCLREGQTDKAQSLLKSIKSGFVDDADLLTVQALLAESLGQRASAHQLAHKALQAMNQSGSNDHKAFCRFQLEPLLVAVQDS